MLEQFSELYTKRCLLSNEGFNDELEALFQDVLENEFKGLPMLMDEHLESLKEPFRPKPTVEELQAQLLEIQNQLSEIRST